MFGGIEAVQWELKDSAVMLPRVHSVLLRELQTDYGEDDASIPF